MQHWNDFSNNPSSYLNKLAPIRPTPCRHLSSQHSKSFESWISSTLHSHSPWYSVFLLFLFYFLLFWAKLLTIYKLAVPNLVHCRRVCVWKFAFDFMRMPMDKVSRPLAVAVLLLTVSFFHTLLHRDVCCYASAQWCAQYVSNKYPKSFIANRNQHFEQVCPSLSRSAVGSKS